MLKFLRKKKNQKKIFILLAIIIFPAFVLWGSASTARRQKGEKNYAGEIFGHKVSFEEYSASFKAAKNKMIMQFGSQLYKIKDKIDLNALAWEHVLLLNEAKSANIKITDRELVDFIRGFAPFQTDGKFSQDIYESTLKYTFAASPREFEEEIRQDLMINILLQKVITKNNIMVTDEEVKEAFKLENKKFNAKKFEAEKGKLREFLLQKKRSEILQKYLEDLRTRAQIKDYISQKS